MPRLLQYKGVSLVSRAIRTMTWDEDSHSAFECDDGSVIQAWQKGGVSEVDNFAELHTPGTVVVAYEIPKMTQYQADGMEDYLRSQIGKGYDFRGVFRFVTRHDPMPYNESTFNIKSYDPLKWFCSCIFFAGGLQVGFPFLKRVPPWRVSPALLKKSPEFKYSETLVVPEREISTQESRIKCEVTFMPPPNELPPPPEGYTLCPA